MEVNQPVLLGGLAKRTARSEWTIRSLLQLGQIEGVRVGRDRFLTVDEVVRQETKFPNSH